MFDKLIESNSGGAEFKKRRGYFLVSSVVVGILFISAVVISIYSQDFGISTDQLEMSQLLSPVAEPPDAPEPVEPRPTSSEIRETNKVPTRQSNMLRIDEPPIVPTGISVVPNSTKERPPGRFEISAGPEIDGNRTAVGTGRDHAGSTEGPGLSSSAAADPKPVVPEPPPVRKPEKESKPRSIGVVNGIAIDLPKPIYPAPARAVGVAGEVKVQVTIDESGKVISAQAVNGHSFLKPEAVKAAWKARFTPTLLSKVPVKVTGVIVYRFNRN